MNLGVILFEQQKCLIIPNSLRVLFLIVTQRNKHTIWNLLLTLKRNYEQYLKYFAIIYS